MNQPSTHASVNAAGRVLADIARELDTAGQVLLAAVEDEASASALIMAAHAILAKAGSLADRTARACGDGPRLQDDDAWLLAPSTREALATLGGATLD